MKLFKFQKKKIDETEYICAKIKGKFPGKVMSELKAGLNAAAEQVLAEPVE